MTTIASTASSSADPSTRVPQLASASSTSGLAYALWRPQMQTHLMRQGVEERDYAEEIPKWKMLVEAVQTDARAAEKAAIALLLGGKAEESKDDVKAEPHTAETTAAKKAVGALIARSSKAFGFLYAALPADLRLLVADVPQGYAYGVWSFLERKYRSTEQDNVAALWRQLMLLSQTPDELFEEYKARVDSVVELLSLAKQEPPKGLYSTILMWNLQPRYATAVLTLRTGDRLKETDKTPIDWAAIAQYMAQYERNQESLGESGGEGERTFAMRSQQQPQRPPTASSSSSSTEPGHRGGRRGWIKYATCYSCGQKGHLKVDCPTPAKKEWTSQKPRRSPRAPSSASSGEESDVEHATRMARRVNRYAVLQEADEDDAKVQSARPTSVYNRSYMARLLNTTKTTYASAASSGAASAAAGAAASSREKEKATARPAAAASSRAPVVASASEPRRETKVLRPLDELLKTTANAVDSAATVSTSCRREHLEGIQRCKPVLIKMADGTVLSAMYKGTLTLRLPVRNDPRGRYVTTKIPDVYYHERFDANLLSWGLMRKHGWEMHSTKEGTVLTTPGGKEVKANTRGGLTLLEDHVEERVYKLGAVVCMTAKDLVAHHRRLGHVSWSRLLEMSKAGATAGIGDIRGMPTAELAKAEKAVKECRACAEAKAHRKPIGHRGLDKGAEAGSVLHMDTMPVMTRDLTTGQKSMRPCLSVKDSFTEFWWTTVCPRMADVQQAAIDVLEHSHTLTGRYPRLIVADLGSEFDNKTVRAFCSRHGIQYQPSPARAKELNGLSEKGVDTLKNHTRAMLFASGAKESVFWRYALTHFVYAWNRTHIGQRTGVPPYQAMTSREPSVLNLAEFGCDVYVHQHRDKRDTTFSRKAEPAVYLGHDARQNCPLALLLRSGKVVLSKDVHFREGSFEHLRALSERREEDVPAYVEDADDDDDAPAAESEFDAVAAEVVEESEADDVSEKRYVLRAITDTRVQDGVKQYLVHWNGYSGTTWEPASLMQEDAPKAVQEFESLLNDRAEVRSSVATRSRTRAAARASAAKGPDTEDDESEVSEAAAHAARRL